MSQSTIFYTRLDKERISSKGTRIESVFFWFFVTKRKLEISLDFFRFRLLEEYKKCEENKKGKYKIKQSGET